MKMTLHHPPPTTTRKSMSEISVTGLILTKRKGGFLGTCWTDSNCHCYCPDFDRTLKEGSWDIHNRCQLSRWHLSRQHLSWQHLPISGISQPKPNLIFWIKIFIGPKFCWPKFFWTQNFCRPKIFVDPKFLWIQIFLNSKFYGPKILCSQNFLNLNFLDLTFFYPNFFEPHFFYLILTWMQQKHKKK